MRQLIGEIRFYKGFYNFYPQLEYRDGAFHELTEEELEELLPDSEVKNINFRYNPSNYDQVSLMEYSFPDASIVVLNYDSDMLNENYDHLKCEIRPTRYYLNAVTALSRQDAGILGELEPFYSIYPMDREEFLKNSVMIEDWYPLFDGQPIYVDVDGYLAGPYEIKEREYDGALYITPGVKTKNYIVPVVRAQEVPTAVSMTTPLGRIDQKAEAVDLITDERLIKQYMDLLGDGLHEDDQDLLLYSQRYKGLIRSDFLEQRLERLRNLIKTDSRFIEDQKEKHERLYKSHKEGFIDGSIQDSLWDARERLSEQIIKEQQEEEMILQKFKERETDQKHETEEEPVERTDIEEDGTENIPLPDETDEIREIKEEKKEEIKEDSQAEVLNLLLERLFEQKKFNLEQREAEQEKALREDLFQTGKEEPFSIDDLIFEMETKNPGIDQDFHKAFLISLMSEPLTFLTGEVGSGKSTYVHNLKTALGAGGRRILVHKSWDTHDRFYESNPGLIEDIRELNQDTGKERKLYLLHLDHAMKSLPDDYLADFLDEGRILYLEDGERMHIPKNIRIVLTSKADIYENTPSPELLDKGFVLTLPQGDYMMEYETARQILSHVSYRQMQSLFLCEKKPLLITEKKVIDQIEELLRGQRKRISFRSLNQIYDYVCVGRQIFDGEDAGHRALDFAIAGKILPSLSGTGQGTFIFLKNLQILLKDFPVSSRILKEMIESGGANFGIYSYFERG